MRNTWLLLRVQLSAVLGINKILHLKDKKERRKKLTGRIAIGLCMLMLLPSAGLYAFMMGMGMNEMGQIGLFPGVTLAVSCIMTLISSVSMAQGTLFAYRDYDLIASLPVCPREIAFSRLLLGYIFNLFFDLFFILPCGAVYAYFARPPISFYPIFLLTMLSAPVVPMIVGSVVGAVAARLTASFRGARYIQMAGLTVLSLGIMSVSMNMENILESGMFANVGVMIGSAMNRIYPLTGLYTAAVRDLSWGAAALFMGVAALSLALMAMVMGRYMNRINTVLTTSAAKGKYRARKLNTSSPRMALYKKELRRYTSSAIWLFNTAFGLILALVGLGFLMVKGREGLQMALAVFELTGMDERLVVYALGYVACFMLMTACTTSCSISMEGKNLWLIQSLPVSGFDVLLSKMMVNLTMTVPASLIIGLGAGWALSLNAWDAFSITALLLAYSLMSAAAGLMINIKSHTFDWVNEAAVVKQGAATGFAMLANLIMIVAPAVLTFVFTEYAPLFFWLAVLCAAGVGCGLLLLFGLRGDRIIREL